jgi:hypothetical protein
MLQITYTRHDGTKTFDLDHSGKTAELLQSQLQTAIDKGNAGNVFHKSMAQYKSVEVK